METTKIAGWPTSVVIPEGHEVRITAETASRDYTGVIVPGEYEIMYSGLAEVERYYADITVLVDTPERRESTVEFGGVALASRTVPADRIEHNIRLYAYQVEGKDAVGSATLVYEKEVA